MFWSTVAAISFISAPSTAPSQLGTFEVVSVDRQVAWAGKLGDRVVETVTVKGERGTFTLPLMRYHTRIAGRPRTYSAGDLLSIKGIIIGDRISAEPSSINLR